MSTAVLIPWRSTGCEHRLRALMQVISRHAENGWPIVLGHHTDGAWCKSLAVRDALDQTEVDTLVVADGDVWTDGLPEAVRAVQGGFQWAVPHRGLHRLTEAATGLYVAGAPLEGLETEERVELGFEGGGITVIRREVYEDCPLDARFRGWGSEDDAWSYALRTLHGAPYRTTRRVPMVHLWHPPQQRAKRAWGNVESRDLRKRYARAQGNEAATRRLIEEAKAHELDGLAEPLVHDHQPHV